VGAGVIQITPQMRILVAIEAVDGRKGIDSLARLCQEKLQADPFSGCLFVFRSRRGTSIRILALRRDARHEDVPTEDDAAERTGVFPSGIVSTAHRQPIALFFTGRQHAGENLADVLQQRAAELAPPSRCVMRCPATCPNCRRN
jgi:hypothetical protein